MDCFGTYFTHVQSCDVTRVQSATQLTASVYFTAHVLDLWFPWTGLHFCHEGRNICNGTVLFGSSLIWFPVGICTTLSIVRYHFHRHFFAELTNFSFVCIILRFDLGIFQIISKDALLWLERGHEWWWTNTAYSCLSNMDSQRKLWEKMIQVWSSVSHYTVYTFVLIKNSMKHLFPQTIVAFVSYMCGR